MSKWLKVMLTVFVMAVFVLLAIGSGGDDDPEIVDDNDEEEVVVDDNGNDEELEDADETFTVGDTVAMGDIEFTVNSARYDDGDDFMQPDEGEKWLVIDCTIVNNADESEAISSMMMFSLYDEEHRSRDLEMGADLDGQLDGELGAGRTMRGEIAYSVPADHSTFEFIFEPNLFGFGQAIFEIEMD